MSATGLLQASGVGSWPANELLAKSWESPEFGGGKEEQLLSATIDNSKHSATRILHVITALPTGGAETMLLRLLSATNPDYSHAVVSLKDEGTIGPRIRELGIPVHALGLRRGAVNPWRVLSLVPLIRRFRPQIIQGWMYHGNVMATLARAASRTEAPVLWGIHQSLDDFNAQRALTRVMIRLGALLSRYASGIVYVSHTSARQHETFGYHPARRMIIPNGFDCRVFRPDNDARQRVRAELGAADDAVLIGLVARNHPVKDHAGFLKAAGLVARNHPQAYFVLIGHGVTLEEPAFRAMVAEQQLQGRTFLLGERSDIPELTAALDIACSASWAESFSTSVGEAMACGAPCVVTAVGDSARMVADTGIVVPPRDPESLARGLESLIDAGPDYRRKLGLDARKRIETEFSLPEIARRYQELYRQHLSRDRD